MTPSRVSDDGKIDRKHAAAATFIALFSCGAEAVFWTDLAPFDAAQQRFCAGDWLAW